MCLLEGMCSEGRVRSSFSECAVNCKQTQTHPCVLSWQQEIWAAIERSRKHSIHWLNGLIDTENIDQEIMIVASGTAVSQGREAIRLLEDEGVRCGLVKIKTLRPWPEEEIREATKNAKHIFVPEFNVTGWLAKEIRATIPNPHRVHA